MDRRKFLSAAVTAVGATAFVAATGAPASAAGKTIVRSVEQLRAAAAAASPGQTIVVENGNYSVPATAPVLLSNIHGSRKKPVTIVAQSRGGAIFNGEASFAFDGATYVTISGFSLKQSTTFEVGASNQHIRLTRNNFEMADIEGLHSVMIRADDTRVDRNHFHNKSTLGVFLCVEGGERTNMAQRVHIFRNHFSDHRFAGANGGEPIRLGVSPRALSSGNAIVEFNLFENTNGDPEAISVKCSDNIVRQNTIRNSAGGIVLRHGNRNLIDGNFIVDGSAGLRIYGNDHVIVNNYIAGIASSAMVIGKGTARDHLPDEDAAARRANDAPDNVQISFNTLIDNDNGIIGETTRPEEPRNLLISENIITGGIGLLANVPHSSGFIWAGNLLWGAAVDGDIPTTGFTRVDPQLVAGTDGIARPGYGSPVVNAASRPYPAVRHDINERKRKGTADVGAHEVSSRRKNRSPLSVAEVGPNAQWKDSEYDSDHDHDHDD